MNRDDDPEGTAMWVENQRLTAEVSRLRALIEDMAAYPWTYDCLKTKAAAATRSTSAPTSPGGKGEP